MKRLSFISLLAFLFVILVFIFLKHNVSGSQKEYVAQEDYVPNEILVKFEKEVNKSIIQNAVNSVQGKIITYLGEKISPFDWSPNVTSIRSFRQNADLLHIKIPEDNDIEQAIYFLNLNPYVKYAEKNVIFKTCNDPNDDDFGLQWALDNTTQTGGTYDADIDAKEAWDIFTGSEDIVVAVIDTGIMYNHKDLQANIWINTPEDINSDGKFTAADINDVDEDGNGFKDDVIGWDFFGTPYYYEGEWYLIPD